MKRGIIIAGGDINFDVVGFIKKEDFIICADCGYKYALDLGIEPDLIVGDFDSSEIPCGFKNIIKLKAEKDDTDTQHCIDYLVSLGFTDIIIFGALGGERFDHTFANIQLLLYGKEKGCNIVLLEKDTHITLIQNETLKISGYQKDIVSVFALGKAEGVCYAGLKYPLINGVITSEVPFGVSNELLENNAQITVNKGKLLIIYIGGGKIERQR